MHKEVLRIVLAAAFASCIGPVALAERGEHPRCFENQEIRFESLAEGITIAGTLSVPRSPGPHPAVLMVTGNGPHTRDQMISKSPMFEMLGDFFAQRGLAVMRTDARGYGESSGPDNYELYTTADRVEDNRAALNFLKRRELIDPEQIILFGHSEGAMIGAELAAEEESLALTIFLATSALPGREVFAQQMADSLRRRGASEEVAGAVQQQLLRFADFLVEDRENRERFAEIAFDFLAAHGVPEDQVDPELAQNLLSGFLEAPWYWYFVGYDPRVALTKIQSPVLSISAEKDQNVPWRLHLPALVSSLAEAPTEDFSAVVLPDQDHFFLEYEGSRLEKHKPGEMSVAEELFRVLESELRRHGLIREKCRLSPQTNAGGGRQGGPPGS